MTSNSQRTKKKPVPKPTGVNILKQDPVFPGYIFHIRVDADKTSQIQVLTGYEYRDLDNVLLKKALSEYLVMQTPKLYQRPVGPFVFIRPNPELDFKTVVDVVKSVRESGPSELTVVTPDGHNLNIPAEPKLTSEINVKPNPLTLVVSLDKSKNITLNNEESGSLSDPSPLIRRLKDIFRERTENAVFREGTYEIYKTVYIKSALSNTFADLIKIAKAVDESGADPLGLQVDDLEQ
ncbi:MAG: hypothetical protein H7070_02770 [Saprospiraceae bacterium]|nr:hypothetical protein [Pyrinomonadaceae bacterium]